MKAPRLKPGDKVGIIAPGARPESAATVAFATRVVEQLGFDPVLGKHVLQAHGHLAGTDAQRLEDLNSFVHDASIRGIFCLSGGFGVLPLLNELDFDALGDNPKVIVGSDENTALLLAVHNLSELVCIYGPNLDRVKTADSFESLQRAVTGKLEAVACKSARLGASIHVSEGYSSYAHAAEGVLIGGNLSSLTLTLGTPFAPEFEDTLLFLDDYNERNDILDRWFTSLYVAGALGETKGVAFGEFTGCGARGNTSVLPIVDLFGERLMRLQKPNLFGLPIGRHDRSLSIPIGIRSRLDPGAGTLEFSEQAVD